MTKTCLSHSMSQEAYIIHMTWFLVHKCVKWRHHHILFFIFSKFWFCGLLLGGGVKGRWPKMTKKHVCLNPYIRNHTSYNCSFWYRCGKWWYPQHFFIFSKFYFCRFLYGGGFGEGQKMTHNCQFQSLTHYIQ